MASRALPCTIRGNLETLDPKRLKGGRVLAKGLWALAGWLVLASSAHAAPPGASTIVASHSGKYVEVPGNVFDNEIALTQAARSGADNQAYSLRVDGQGRWYETGQQVGRLLMPVDDFPALQLVGKDILHVLGCPGGRTPRPIYCALADVIRNESLEIDHLVIAMMDEYVLPDEQGGFHAVDAHAHFSCTRFARVEILELLNQVAAHAPIPVEQLWLPDPACPEHYDRRLLAAGGIDLFLLASGASDGHVAFNPPGSASHTRTRIIELATSTRTDNLATLPDFSSIDEVPYHGVSVGIQTIAALSHRAALVLFGTEK